MDENDKFYNRWLNFAGFVDQYSVPEIVERISRGEESSRKNNIQRGNNEDHVASIKKLVRVNMKEHGSTELKHLKDSLLEKSLQFFENFTEFVTEVLQKHYNVWQFDKKKLAVGIILFARSCLTSGNSTWTSRLEDMSVMMPNEVRECFTSICHFFNDQVANKCSPAKIAERQLKPNLQPTSMTSINSIKKLPSSSSDSQSYKTDSESRNQHHCTKQH